MTDNLSVRGPKNSDHRRSTPEELVAEARHLAADPVDRAEIQALSADMDALAAPWPDDDWGATDRRRRQGAQARMPDG